MLELKTKYITADDFKQYFGIDLNIELPDNDNPSDKVNAFLFRVENRIAAWIDANYFIKVDRHWEILSEEQKLQYKLALLEQAKYQIEVGDIGTDSGYDRERGVVASHSVLQSKIIAPYAYNHLVVGGFLDNRLTKRGGTFSTEKYVKPEPVIIQGQKGDPGADGKTPHIQDGYWYIGLVNTGVKAQATDGKDGLNGNGFVGTITANQIFGLGGGEEYLENYLILMVANNGNFDLTFTDTDNNQTFLVENGVGKILTIDYGATQVTIYVNGTLLKQYERTGDVTLSFNNVNCKLVEIL